jgi:dUTP pyrophosphatase
MIELDVSLLKEGAKLPKQAHRGDGAFDLYAYDAVVVEPRQRQVVGSGIAVAVPAGYGGLVLPRSGLAAQHGVTVLNSPGLIDSGYRGEVRVVLYNASEEPFLVSRGDRVAQLMIVALPEIQIRSVDMLSEGVRGEGGFGSSGR